ncbi:MAG: CAP domain-containing protein, partial [Tissierellia bacterium]|nr:CAP domain-containing protein [Tissierellia bacterium]
PVEPTKPVEKPTYPPVVEETEQNYSGLSADEAEVVRLVNIERQKAGLQPLKASAELSNVARLKSKDMADKNYFSHTSPTYGSPFDMMKQFGINYRTAGENIAKGYLNPTSVMNGWMNSSGHKANILNSSFGTIGVGAYKVGNTIYWTQMFTN